MAPRTPTAPTAPLTAAEIAQQIAAVQLERAAIVRMLEGIPERERELLEREAPDADFVAVDSDRKRGNFRLERLADRHDELIRGRQSAEDVERATAWQGFVDRYESTAIALRDAGRLLDQWQGRMAALAQEADRAGFSRYNGDAHLQVYCSPHVQVPLESMVDMVGSLRRLVTVRISNQLYMVRFLEWTMVDTGFGYQSGANFQTAYMTGQEAGFSAEMAWGLVTSQKAVWANPALIPPRPEKKRRHPKPRRVPGQE